MLIARIRSFYVPGKCYMGLLYSYVSLLRKQYVNRELDCVVLESYRSEKVVARETYNLLFY